MSESENSLIHTLMLGMQWLSSLVYLNLLWLLGVLAGGIILGIGPATLSLCAVLREQIWNQRDIEVSSFFFKEYKRVWKESNRFIFLFYGIYLFLWVDFWAIIRFAPSIFIVFAFFTVLIFLVTCYYFLFYEVLNRPFWTKLKNSLLLPWLFPAQSLGIIITAGGFLLLLNQFPVVSVLFSVSAPFSLFFYILRNKYWRNFRSIT